MGDMYQYDQTIIEELVGIVGMLSNRSGSTMKDISSVLETLHGPVRKDVVQGGLRAAVLSGMLKYHYRRYKVSKQRCISEKVSEVSDEAGCSSWGTGSLTRDTDSREVTFSVSSPSSQEDQDDLECDSSLPPSECFSVKEIMSVKDIQSSGQPSTCSCLSESEGSEIDPRRKEGKRKRKTLRTVKLPMLEENSTSEIDTRNAATKKVDECEQKIHEDKQTQDSLQYETNDNLCVEKTEDDHSPAKISINDIMQGVMKQFLEHNPNDNEDCNKEAINRGKNKSMDTHDDISEIMTEVKTNREENESKDSHADMSRVITKVMKKVNNSQQSYSIGLDAPETPNNGSESKVTENEMSKLMTQVMKKVNIFEQSDSTKAPETSSKEESGIDIRNLSGAINKVMKKLTGRDVQRRTTPVALDNNMSPCDDDESNIETASRSVGTEPRDVLPSCSTNKISKSAKRGKKAKQENETNDMAGSHRYFTRSRAKADELRRCRVESPSESVTSFKRPKLS